MPIRVPCASRAFGRSPNSQAGYNPGQLEQGGSLDPKSPAMLGCAHGSRVSCFQSRWCSRAPHEKTGSSAPPVRARSERKRGRRVGRARVFQRSAGNPAVHLRCAVGPAAGFAFLLGTFLWRSKEKYLARNGRNPGEMTTREEKPAGNHPAGRSQYHIRSGSRPSARMTVTDRAQESVPTAWP